VPVEVFAVEGVAELELFEHGVGVDAYAHGAEFEAAVEGWVPEEDVAVEAFFAIGGGGGPVVVVWGAAVVDVAVG